MIYLDNASTTFVSIDVLREMVPYFGTEFGNAGSIHKLGIASHEAVETARKRVAELLHCKQEQILFTSGSSEGNSMVFCGMMDCLSAEGKRGIVVSAIEHESVLRSAEYLKDYHGFDVVKVLPERDGTVSPAAVTDAISAQREVGITTGLVSVMMANNETGALNDVTSIATICHANGALFHVDATQAVGFFPIDVDKIGCDYLTISAHKLHGPKGIGALYVRNKAGLHPIIFGGSVQEFGLRAGTENTPSIAGFGKACELAKDSLHDKQVHITTMKQDFYMGLEKRLYDIYGDNHILSVNGPSPMATGKVLSLQIHGVDTQTLLLLLSNHDVFVSAGSACCAHDITPSHVLLAMGLSEEEARSTIRVSFSDDTTEEQVTEAVSIFAKCISMLLPQ